jgi:hypothetical protein
MPRARMVFADQTPHQRRVRDGTLLRPGSPDPVSRPLRHTFLLTFPRADDLATVASYVATTGAL